MLDRLSAGKRLVGTKQVLKGVASGSVQSVYVALDCDPRIRAQIEDACEKAQVPLYEAATMKALGAACHIDVGAACAAIPAGENGRGKDV